VGDLNPVSRPFTLAERSERDIRTKTNEKKREKGKND
jgi:hypothetical protein